MINKTHQRPLNPAARRTMTRAPTSVDSVNGEQWPRAKNARCDRVSDVQWLRPLWRVVSPCGQWTARSLDTDPPQLNGDDVPARRTDDQVRLATALLNRCGFELHHLIANWVLLNYIARFDTKCNVSTPATALVAKVCYVSAIWGNETKIVLIPQQCIIELRLEIRRCLRITSRRLTQPNKHASKIVRLGLSTSTAKT